MVKAILKWKYMVKQLVSRPNFGHAYNTYVL